MEMTSSAYQCNCPICGYETSDDRQFKLHVDYNHPPFWYFKNFYGHCQTLVKGSGVYTCEICSKKVKHIPSAVEGHLKKVHQITWEDFKMRKLQAMNEPKIDEAPEQVESEEQSKFEVKNKKLATPSEVEFLDEQDFLYRLKKINGTKSDIQNIVMFCMDQKEEDYYRLARCWKKSMDKCEDMVKKKALLYLCSEIVQAAHKFKLSKLLDKYRNAIESSTFSGFSGIEKSFQKICKIWSIGKIFPSKTIMRWKNQIEETSLDVTFEDNEDDQVKLTQTNKSSLNTLSISDVDADRSIRLLTVDFEEDLDFEEDQVDKHQIGSVVGEIETQTTKSSLSTLSISDVDVHRSIKRVTVDFEEDQVDKNQIGSVVGEIATKILSLKSRKKIEDDDIQIVFEQSTKPEVKIKKEPERKSKKEVEQRFQERELISLLMQLENEESRWTGEENFEMMQKEVNLRREVVEMLEDGKIYFEEVLREVTDVTQAYKNLQARTEKVKSALLGDVFHGK